MGLFSSSKSSRPTPSDKVWKTRSACLKGTATQALLAVRESRIPIVVTFFEESHNAFVGFLKQTEVPHQEVTSFGNIDLLQNKNTIAILRASGSGFASSIHKEVKAAILLLGRYPLADTENKVIDDLATHFPGSSISFCLSLEDGFFEVFGSENLKTIMDTLGMKDDEFVEHKLVSKAIKNAQEKIARNVVVEAKARSEKEWMEKNVKR
ncbi:MAG TPA: hypothetical protein VG737_16780 [Cyclobacteriaceae bacterium]|nr:hypothetical protein [Cyclobacteriaceae bacterium]